MRKGGGGKREHYGNNKRLRLIRGCFRILDITYRFVGKKDKFDNNNKYK